VTDTRIAAVEDNLVDFFRAVTDDPILTVNRDPDVASFYSDRAFPLLNAIVGATFAPGAVERRAREVVAPYGSPSW
jgi:hypothetical protein